MKPDELKELLLQPKPVNGRENFANDLRWLCAASAVMFFAIVAMALAEDCLPYLAARFCGYLVMVAAVGGCSWLWGYCAGRKG